MNTQNTGHADTSPILVTEAAFGELVRANLRSITRELIRIQESCREAGAFDGYAPEADHLAGIANSIYLDALDGGPN